MYIHVLVGFGWNELDQVTVENVFCTQDVRSYIAQFQVMIVKINLFSVNPIFLATDMNI